MNLIYAKDIEKKDIPVLENENITKYLLTITGNRTDEYNNVILEYNVDNYPIFYKGHERLKDIEAYNYNEFPGYLAVKYENKYISLKMDNNVFIEDKNNDDVKIYIPRKKTLKK